ncbi:hypothetical protein CCACVL1_06897 [Corchorus capsularis]|uniref:Uncharacterized protein n=1 Tax=Corchorus capsularis TaxID=210143 RepID=A0A1R3JBP1_COCAP|nr:hypothetical protein CCACVL1_06897 [Corchorus capsularis]
MGWLGLGMSTGRGMCGGYTPHPRPRLRNPFPVPVPIPGE